jgi:hypothetical protein
MGRLSGTIKNCIFAETFCKFFRLKKVMIKLIIYLQNIVE